MLDASRALLACMRGGVRAEHGRVAGRIATVVLLAGIEGELRNAAVDGLVRGRFRVDKELLLSLYRSTPRSIRPSLAAAVPVSYLDGSEYRRVWRDALRATRDDERRVQLARTLDGFLSRNPGEARHFAAPIRRFLGADNIELHGMGLLLASVLPTPNARDIKYARVSLASRNPHTLLCGLGALQRWLVRAEAASPNALAFARSETAIAAARQAQRHHDAAVRMAARNYLRILRRRTASWRVTHGRTTRSRREGSE